MGKKDDDLAKELESLSHRENDPRRKADMEMLKQSDAYFLLVRNEDSWDGRMYVPDGKHLEMFGAVQTFISRTMVLDGEEFDGEPDGGNEEGGGAGSP